MKSRREQRKGRYTPVVVSHDDWLWPEVLVATDVSPQGLFVTSERLVGLGEEVRLSYRLGTAERWELLGRVVWQTRRRRRSDPGYCGMGVELLDSSPLERLRMRTLLRKVPPIVPREVRKRAAKGQTERRRRGRAGGRRSTDERQVRGPWVRRRY